MCGIFDIEKTKHSLINISLGKGMDAQWLQDFPVTIKMLMECRLDAKLIKEIFSAINRQGG